MDLRTVAGEGPQAPETLYTRARAREMKFTHFSASRSNTRAQFLRWFSAAPPAISDGIWSDDGIESASSAKFPAAAKPSFGRDPGANQPAPPADGPRERARHEDNAEILPQWVSMGLEARGSESEAGGGDAARSETATSACGANESVTGPSSSSRWLLLNEVAPPSPDVFPGSQSIGGRIHLVPTLLAFSIAGGTGKTTVLATLARSLAANGERILLADTTHFNLAPCYFGATPGAPADAVAGESEPTKEQAREPVPSCAPAKRPPASVRTFSPPPGRGDAPVDILLLPPTGRRAEDRGAPDAMREVLLDHAVNADRVLVDVQTGSESAVRRLLWLEPLVLIPLLPDMNSVATVATVERVFTRRPDKGCAANLVWLLNQYDPALPLHLDVRAALERQLGERLLPFVVRRSPEVSEALAEGMTVVDYAPNSAAAEDYARLAEWLRERAPAQMHGLQRLRWSEA